MSLVWVSSPDGSTKIMILAMCPQRPLPVHAAAWCLEKSWTSRLDGGRVSLLKLVSYITLGSSCVGFIRESRLHSWTVVMCPRARSGKLGFLLLGVAISLFSAERISGRRCIRVEHVIIVEFSENC